MPRIGSFGSSPDAAEAAADELRAGRGALAAVISGFFADAGVQAGVLFAPLCLTVGAVGTPPTVYDGRCRQPGLGARRPRGFQDEHVPLSARAAIPAGLSALAVATAFHPGTSLLACAKAGIRHARSQKMKARAELIDRVAGLGGRALQDVSLKRELLARFAAVEGGSLTTEDLAGSSNLQRPATTRDDFKAELPWGHEIASQVLEGSLEGKSNRCVLAIDAQGMCAVISYRPLTSLLYLERFQVAFPALAVPVMRGVARVSPGAIVATWFEHWLRLDDHERPCGAAARLRPDHEPVELLRNPETREVILQRKLDMLPERQD